MMRDIQKCVAECLTCQQQKYQATSPASLFQPLPIPKAIWEDISMDFIIDLPHSHGIDCIFTVTDRLSSMPIFWG